MPEGCAGGITERRFGVDWQAADSYDLVLNTERLTVDECVDEIAALLGEPNFQETSESMRIFANLALQMHVRAALRHDPRTARMNVGIDALDGRVTLRGILEPGLTEEDALEVARDVQGVSAIESQLRSSAVPRYSSTASVQA